MNECKFPTSLLVEFLTKHLETPQMPIPEDLAAHAKNCPVCSRLLAEEHMARAFVTFYRSHQKHAKTSSLPLKHSCAAGPGQIWRFFFGPEKQSDFCLITSSPFKGHKDLDLAVRIAPLYLSPNPQELGPSDILIPSGENALGVPVLVETWNERPILCVQLMEYSGQLEEALFDRVKIQLEDRITETITKTIQVFRRHEIARGGLFSDMTFRQLAEAEEKVQAHEYKYATSEGGLKLLYIKLGSLVKEILCPGPSFSFILRENSTATIFAASESKDNLFLKALYSKLVALLEMDGDLPFRVRQSENYALQLVHTGRQNFILSIKMICGSGFDMASVNGVCHINVESAGLPASEDIALITLEEK
ncbi:MAG TPA: hypothetical protein PLK28_06305 [Candidatus Rifleibacterium sp.]|nr:hypothetical protein [Candidatus Rifleibacterium sp.]